MSLLEIRDLQIEFHMGSQTVKAVQGMSLDVETGEIVGLVGESGSGKSVSMLAVMGLLDQHSITVEGSIRCAGKMAMIFQDAFTCLNPTMTIGSQIIETIMVHRRCKKKTAVVRAVELLEQVGIRTPERCMKQYPFELSGGMLQRVVIVIALACDPALIIADEPTTSLDVTVQAQILDLMKCIARETGVAILLISHDMGVVASLCERVYIMHQGRIIETGSTEDIFYHPQQPYTAALLGGGKESRMKEHSKENWPEEVILTVDNVVKHYDAKAVDGVSFTIKKGETLGLVGESSCGKSTLARLITGVRKPDRGAIFYKDTRLDTLSARQWRPHRQNIQMIFQNPYASLNPRMTVGEIIGEPLYAMKMGNQEQREEAVLKIMKAVGLEAEYITRYPHEFSGGERQRIGIARALIVKPELVICDEPLSALDASIQGQVLELLERFQKEQDLSYLFIAHDLELVKRISHRTAVMCLGTIVEMGSTREVYQDPWHPYTKALLSASPSADPRIARKKKRVRLQGKDIRVDLKCPFAKDCRYALEVCHLEKPKTYNYGTRSVTCFLYSDKFTDKRDARYQMASQI